MYSKVAEMMRLFRVQQKGEEDGEGRKGKRGGDAAEFIRPYSKMYSKVAEMMRLFRVQQKGEEDRKGRKGKRGGGMQLSSFDHIPRCILRLPK